MGRVIPLASPDLSGNEQSYIADAIRSGWVSKGEYVKRFERDFGALFGMRAASCSSGTAALHLSLLAADVRGRDVLVPDLTFAATANAVIHAGGRPVLCDVGERGLLGASEIIRRLTPDTKAILPVHLYGLLCDMDAIMEIARHKSLTVIEDAAETCHPYRIQGDYACFSFYGNKAITTGEGGAVLRRSEVDLDRVRLLRDHGVVRPYHHTAAGLNYRLTNLQAALGCAQLERYAEFGRKRLSVWRRYKASLPGWGDWLWVCPRVDIEGMETRPIFDPLHMQDPYRQPGEFPMSERLWRENMLIPMGPHLSDNDVETIIARYLEGLHRVRPPTAGGLSGPAPFDRDPLLETRLDLAAHPRTTPP